MYDVKTEGESKNIQEIAWLQNIIHSLDKIGAFSRWLNVLGVAALFLMVVVTFIDVILRYFFNSPIKGIAEITEVMLIAAIYLGVGHTQNEKGHIVVDVITSKLAPKSKLVIDFINTLLSIGLFVVIIWRTLAQVQYFVSENTSHSIYMYLPSAPFGVIIALGSTLLCLFLIRDLLRVIADSMKLNLRWYHWLLMIGVPLLLTVLAVFWTQKGLWNINLTMVGVLAIVVSLILMFMGMPISFGLLLTSFLFIAHIRGMNNALEILGPEMYRTSGTYSWAVLPFFVLLGFICLYSKFGEDLYVAAYKWFGHFKGGLAIATVAACTGFAAIVGDSVSATATMGAAALPQMRKYGYDDKLSAGCIVGGATLGPIIPPSGTFIMVGILTQVSIGALFIAGLIPGLLMAACFVITILIWCRLNTNVAPAGEKSGWIARIVSLKAGGPVLFLFLVVVGGIYFGIFSPTEGGAIGVVGAIIMSLIWKRFTWKSFTQALLEAGKVMSNVFLIIVGAVLFARLAAWCNLSNTMTASITGLGLSATSYVIFVLVVFIILGFFIDVLPLILIGIPIVFPVASSLGVNPIWFNVMLVIAINLGCLTPPVGINLFVLKGMYKEMPMGVIYKGAMPFVAGTVIAIILTFMIPALATWLPSLGK